MRIPFNKPLILGDEIEYIKALLKGNKLAGDGPYTKKCQELIERRYGTKKTLLTTSATKGFEMAYILSNIKPGDEIIIPSFAFVSVASALMIQGAKPVFVDIREDTLNIDENKIESAISDKTKAILVIHYGGVSCDMASVMDIAKRHNLVVIEDAAHALDAKYNDKYLGTIGDFGCYSFHETKNITCGEGGAININNPEHIERAEIIWEKGTNRKQFLRGEVDKYSWVDIGSSFLLSDILAAFLYPQLIYIQKVTAKRKEIYEHYHKRLRKLEQQRVLKLPAIPVECKSNYHTAYILLPTQERRNEVIDELKKRDIQATFHFVPLHTSKMGQKLGYKEGELPITENVSSRLVRLPMYYGLTKEDQDYVISSLEEILSK